MFPGKRHLLVGLALCAVLLVASLRTRQLRPAHPNVAIATVGSFQLNGAYPGEPFANAGALRLWGSWSGSDENTGTITIGPFPAPRILRFGLTGYPAHEGVRLHAELDGGAEKFPLTHGDLHERWEIADFELPLAWVGRPIRIVGSDQTKTLGGWFGLSEPLRGGHGDGNNGLLETLAAWTINGLLLGLLFFASLRWLLARAWLAPQWVPLGAAAIVAACGYLAFWAYFANALLGVIFSWAVLATGLVLVLRRPPRGIRATPEVTAVVQLFVAVGAFHLAVLHLFPSSHDFYTLAANRFRDGLPADNVLPHVLSSRLFSSQAIRHTGEEWLSSDRPPLQSGWQLLTWPAGKLVQLDRGTMSGTSAVWFQLLWIAAAYGLMRTLHVARSRAAGWVVVLALSGFFLQNTTFTWPKLSAGAFACAAFALLFLPAPDARPRVNGWWSAFFAGLAWLSHGGVAFSFLPLLPWLLWRAVRGEWRPWLPGAATLLLLVLPWLAYQKFYDPPANRLFKWHLAGQIDIDPRGTLETIRTSYAKVGWKGAWDSKVSNFQFQFVSDLRSIGQFSAEGAAERRNQEFFVCLRALTWWPALAVLGLILTRRRVFLPAYGLAVTGGWLTLTMILWCLLMFIPSSAYIHQGSYAMMIGLFVLLSVIIERTGRGWLAIIAMLQGVTLATTWAVANVAIHGPPSGLPFVIASAGVLAWIMARAFRSRPNETEPIPAPSESSVIENACAALRDWWQNPRLNLGVLAVLAGVMLLRKPHALLTPQLWAEDGSVFLNDQDDHGLGAFLLPYMGYLHTLPRIVASLASHLLDPASWPAFYNGAAFAIWVAVLARLFTSRFDLPGKPWLALAFLLVPHSGEVFFNITNLQWLTAFVLIQQAIIAPPKSRGEAIGDLVILVPVALTGPFVIAFLPLFAWRWWRARDRNTLIVFGVAAVCAAVQAWLIVRTGPKFEFQSAAFHLWPNLVVIARRLIVWPLLGRDLALGLSPAIIGGAGGVFLAGVLAWVLRPAPLRLHRAQIVAAFALIVFAAVYRSRPDTWAGDNLDFGDRYFYIPRVLLAWLVIWEFNAQSKLVANAARLLCLGACIAHLGNYSLGAPKDYRWAEHCDPIRRGVPANIPTLPEGWTLEYRGWPKPK